MEKCDGQRNLLHMCAEASIPSSNKEQKAEEKDEKARKQAKAAASAASARKGRLDFLYLMTRLFRAKIQVMYAPASLLWPKSVFSREILLDFHADIRSLVK